VGCIVSLITPTRSPLNASRSVSSLSLAERASKVFLASYLLRLKLRSMNDSMPANFACTEFPEVRHRET